MAPATQATYLLECVINHHLAVGIRYSREEITDSGVGLCVYFRLSFGYRFDISGIIDFVGQCCLTESLNRLVYNGFSKMVSNSVNMFVDLLKLFPCAILVQSSQHSRY